MILMNLSFSVISEHSRDNDHVIRGEDCKILYRVSFASDLRIAEFWCNRQFNYIYYTNRLVDEVNVKILRNSVNSLNLGVFTYF